MLGKQRKLALNIRAMLDATDELVLQHSWDGHLLGVNKAASKSLGYTRAELLRLNLWQITHHGVVTDDPSSLQRLRLGEKVRYRTTLVTRDGHHLHAEASTQLATWLPSPRLVTVARDISHWLHTERQLEESRRALERARNRLESRVHQRARELKRQITVRQEAEKNVAQMRQFLYAMIDTMPSSVFAVDIRGTVTQWNRQAEKLFQMPASLVIGKPLIRLLPQLHDDIERFARIARSGRLPHSERVQWRVNGSRRLLEVVIYDLRVSGVRGWVVRADDVTEKAAVDEMLIQSEKMLSLGGLAAGMAHEINNPLGAILQSVENLKRRLSPDYPGFAREAEKLQLDKDNLQTWLHALKVHRPVQIMEEASQRAAAIVREMLSFARPGDSEDEAIDLASTLEASLRLAQQEYHLKKRFDFRRIEVVRHFADGVSYVRGRRPRLQQVFLNLFTNAAQAMSEAGTKAPRLDLYLSQQGDWVVVSVVDNGPGMAPEVCKRVFEPFFTTKPEGSGTGLGLSVSYFIVTEQMGGQMSVESEPGQGCRFTLRLPALVSTSDSLAGTTPGRQFQLPLEEDAQDLSEPGRPASSSSPDGQAQHRGGGEEKQ